MDGGGQHGDGATPIRDLEALAAADSTQGGACVLLQLSHADLLHVRQCSTTEPLGTKTELDRVGMIHYYDAELHRLRAEILLDTDGNAVEEAEALLGQSLEIARRQEARTFELRAATTLARLWQRQGKREKARALLAPLYAWFTEGFDTRDLIDAKALLEEVRD